MIRSFSFSDLDHILQIEKQSFPKSPYDWAAFMNLYYLYPETFWVYTNISPDKEKDEILGYIIYSQDGHVISIAVHPLYRRKGIGKELLQRAMDTPRLKTVWAEVRKNNRRAQSFYFHMGFQIVGAVPNYYGNEDALIIQWIPSARKHY
jgi:ribosomal-protein-alanine N-acetyltransferase